MNQKKESVGLISRQGFVGHIVEVRHPTEKWEGFLLQLLVEGDWICLYDPLFEQTIFLASGPNVAVIHKAKACEECQKTAPNKKASP